jgi:hypothetical protein
MTKKSGGGTANPRIPNCAISSVHIVGLQAMQGHLVRSTGMCLSCGRMVTASVRGDITVC